MPSLPPAATTCSSSRPDFSRSSAPAEVTTGSTTTVKVGLEVGHANGNRHGDRRDDVGRSRRRTGCRASSDGTQIENLPLNGRSFMNLAALQPGVTVALGNPAQFNAQFNVSVLGGPASRTAITVDGGNIRNPVEGGHRAELLAGGRAGVPDLDGELRSVDGHRGVRRDQHRDAVGLQRFPRRRAISTTAIRTWRPIRAWRATRSPTIPSSRASRAGFVLGGPIKKRQGPFLRQLRAHQSARRVRRAAGPAVGAGFGTLAPAPYMGNQVSGRVDFRLKQQAHPVRALLARRQHQQRAVRHSGAAVELRLEQELRRSSSCVGITSVLSPTLVNDFRFSLHVLEEPEHAGAVRGRHQRQLRRVWRAGDLLSQLGELRARKQLQLAAGPRHPPLPDLEQHHVAEGPPLGEVRRDVGNPAI